MKPAGEKASKAERRNTMNNNQDMNDMELNLEELGSITGAGIDLKPGITRERQEEIVRKHFINKANMLNFRYEYTPEDAVRAEIGLNDQINNSFLTEEDIKRIASEVYGRTF